MEDDTLVLVEITRPYTDTQKQRKVAINEVFQVNYIRAKQLVEANVAHIIENPSKPDNIDLNPPLKTPEEFNEATELVQNENPEVTMQVENKQEVGPENSAPIEETINSKENTSMDLETPVQNSSKIKNKRERKKLASKKSKK